MEKSTIQEVWRNGQRNRWEFVMRSVFGDESQDESKQRVFAFSGIFGRKEEWDDFTDKWKKVTGGRIFHAADCESDHGDFAKTSHQENLELYKDLTGLLVKTNFLAYTVSMDLAAYREVFLRTPDQNDPYYFCFYAIVEKFSEINAYEIPRDTLEFTFDLHLESRYNAAALYECVRTLPEWNGHDLLAQTVSYTTREEPRIQAADLVAREGMKRLDNRIGPVQRPKRLSLLALEGTKRFAFIEFGREYFQNAVKNANSLRDLPGADREKYHRWLQEKRLVDNTSNRIRYHRYIVSKIQRPAQKD